MDESFLVTHSEAARILGRSVSTIGRAVKQGDFNMLIRVTDCLMAGLSRMTTHDVHGPGLTDRSINPMRSVNGT